MSQIIHWSYPTTIWFGQGSITELTNGCSQLGITHPLIVTDSTLAKLPIVSEIFALLSNKGYKPTIFSEIATNPNEQHLNAGVDVFRNGGHDGVIALGGGSALDLGKGIAFMQAQNREVWDFEDKADWWKRANSHSIAPTIAIATTAGTGSEVGRAFVLTNTKTHMKKIIFHPNILPKIVIADPILTTGMPAAITAGTGMDAFAHCLEAYCSAQYHPMSQGIAVEGMRLIYENLTTAFHNPQHLGARSNMLSAAMMGAVAFQKGLGAIHALSHPISARFGTHHGTTNAVFMVPVLKHNKKAIQTKITTLAAYLGIDDAFDGFCRCICSLNSELGIPTNLRELGVSNADWNQLANEALADPSLANNPIALDHSALVSLYQQVC